MVLYFGLTGWLPNTVLRIQVSVLCALALITTVPCYIVVVYKVKMQRRKIAVPSHGGGGAPATSQATAMADNKNETLPSAAEMPKSSTKPGGGAQEESHAEARNADAVAVSGHHVSLCRVVRSSLHRCRAKSVKQS